MRRNAMLFLVEQLFMVVTLIVAAAISVKAFTLSHSMNEEAVQYDNAVRVCESAVELVKHYRDPGRAMLDLCGRETLEIGYDGNWNADADDCRYLLSVEDEPYRHFAPSLGSARVSVYDTERCETMVTLWATWQED